MNENFTSLITKKLTIKCNSTILNHFRIEPLCCKLVQSVKFPKVLWQQIWGKVVCFVKELSKQAHICQLSKKVVHFLQTTG